MPDAGALSRVLRVFMALSTFLLLTVTVLQTDDRDGYQATHLFFMPRDNWEMDLGQGMLFDEEHYQAVDLEIVREEAYGPEGDIDAGSAGVLTGISTPRHGSFLKRTPSAPGQAGSEVPVTQLSQASPLDRLVEHPVVSDAPCIYDPWLGDTPSPPPRFSSSL